MAEEYYKISQFGMLQEPTIMQKKTKRRDLGNTEAGVLLSCVQFQLNELGDKAVNAHEEKAEFVSKLTA